MRYIPLRIALKLLNRDIFKEFSELKGLEYNSLEENLGIQETRLRDILLHAWKYVPYYRRILKETGVINQGQVYLENFDKIPILSKEVIRNNFEDLKSREPNNKRKPYVDSSGGSTGEPVKFIRDELAGTRGIARTWLFYSFVTKFPCRVLQLWGSERDILIGGYGLKSHLRNWLYNTKTLNAFKMSERDMNDYVDEINRYQPQIIEAYVQPIYELARFIKTNRLRIHSPKGVITSAGTLYPDMQELIEAVFGCKVFNRYGSREAGDMACSCEQDEGLHLTLWDHYLEILNDELEPCKPGEIGQVYVTTLDNYSMPLIRYQIGDMAVAVQNKKCSCGRGMPLVEQVVGRQMDVFKTKEGGIVPGEFFIHFIGVVYNKDIISRFQVIQQDYDRITIKTVVKDRQRFMEYEKDITNSIKKVMGSDCKVVWEFVEDIQPAKSGKYFYTISEIK